MRSHAGDVGDRPALNAGGGIGGFQFNKPVPGAPSVCKKCTTGAHFGLSVTWTELALVISSI